MNIPDGIIYAGIPILAGAVGWVVSKIYSKDHDWIITQKMVNDQVRTANLDLQAEVDELKINNEKCELERAKDKLELTEIKRQMGFKTMLRGKVYILDDDQDDLDEFYRELDTISIVDYKGFRVAQQFVNETQRNKPEIVVIDHLLDDKQTAKDIIMVLGYTPEILIMSGSSNFAAEYENLKVKFFVKEGKYQLNIIFTIIEFLSKR